ncbi:MAG: hypothetical protein JWR00_1041 [Rubritepida sp.]|nr:hypothetical protein [Rubritepida sp.]
MIPTSMARLVLLVALTLPWLSACSHPSPQEAAGANDAQCRSYGFERGSVRYTECRTLLDRRSALVASRPPGSGNPAGLPIYLPPPDLPSPEERGCMAVPINGQLYTNCP